VSGKPCQRSSTLLISFTCLKCSWYKSNIRSESIKIKVQVILVIYMKWR